MRSGPFEGPAIVKPPALPGDTYWLPGKKEPDCLWFELDCEEWYAKHYADESLAEFISQVIAEGTYCVLEFQGEDGAWWGYYITKDSVKEIKYVRMVDGKLIETT